MERFGGGEILKATVSRDGQSFSGYGVAFGRDFQDEVIDRGALSPGVTVPLCVQHDHSSACGTFTFEKADERGWLGRGKIVTATERGRETAALLLAGALPGLSIGGKIIKARGSSPRIIEKMHAHEVSLCVAPVNDAARVTAFKSFAAEAAAIATAMRGNERDIAVKLAAIGPAFPREESRQNFISQYSGNDPAFAYFFDLIRQEIIATGSAGLVAVTSQTSATGDTPEGTTPANEFAAIVELVTSPSLKWAVVNCNDVPRTLLEDAPNLRAWLDRAIVLNAKAIADAATIQSVRGVAMNAGEGADLAEACARACGYVAGYHSPTAVAVNAGSYLAEFGVRDMTPRVGGTVPIVPVHGIEVGEAIAVNRDAATFFTNGEVGLDVAWSPTAGLTNGTRTVTGLLGHACLVSVSTGVARATVTVTP
jgi:hypothetical protein